MEDKLQEGVPEAIEQLIAAGIKVSVYMAYTQVDSVDLRACCHVPHHCSHINIVNPFCSPAVPPPTLRYLNNPT